MPVSWQNWSGNQQHVVAKLATPTTEADIMVLLVQAAEANQIVRPIGSAHSFVPFWTDDVLLSLDGLTGLVRHDAEKQQATFWAGTKLHEIGKPAWELGLSLQNMGDIDRQSVAGAISTGTHGTGKHLPAMSSQLVKLRLITAVGEVHEIVKAEESKLFRAVQISLGTLGVVTQATFQMEPAYYLRQRVWQATVAECEERLDELITHNRHWEFFWRPQSDLCEMKTLNKVKGLDIALAQGETVGRNYEILPSERNHKFNEIEFSVPAAAGWDCFLAVRKLMQTRYPEVQWPLEYRTLAADDSLIGTASGRESVTISAHEGAGKDYRPFFDDVEAIFRAYDGRPHWGKYHTHKASELAGLYPEWARFGEVRKKMDENGRFLNPFLRAVLVGD